MSRPKKSSVNNQKLWEDKINRALGVRKKWKELFRVDLLREFFDGKQNPGMPSEEWITINKIYSHLKAQLPALYNADPYFYVKLKKSFSPNPMDVALFESKGKIRQAYLNYLKEELKLKIKARLSIQDAHFAYGIAKVYYAADLEDNPDAGGYMKGDDGLPLLDGSGQPINEPDVIPINERYCLSRLHPDDFLWDEDSGPLEENWKWLAQLIRMTRGDALKDKKFNKAAIKALKSGGETTSDERKAREDRKKGGDITGRSESMATANKEKEDVDPLYFWEIYDLEKHKMTVICEGGEIPLIDEEDLPPGVEDHPFSILRFTMRDDSPYPIPPLSPMIDPQKEYNLGRSRIVTHRKRFNRKYQATGQWDDAELSKLESGDDGTVIKSGTPGSTIAPIADAPLDQMGYAELNLLNNDMIELGGQATSEARGIAGADSATQAGIMDKRLELKEGDALSMVIDFVRDIAEKLDKLVQAHITKDEAVRITGPQGEQWEVVRAKDYKEINGEFEYSVNVGATVPRLPQMERSQWMAFLQLIMGAPPLLTAPHFMKRMAEMFHIEDEAMVEELRQIGLKIMSGQMPMPKPGGSQAGVSETKPASVVGGQVGGPSSLMMPLAGNAPR